MNRLRSILFNFLLPLLVIGVTVELLAHYDRPIYRWLNGRDRPLPSSQIGYFDQYNFFHHRPYASSGRRRMNNLGFNDYEDYQLAKSPNEIRIIVIGNSIAAGTADEGTAWPVLLREELRQQHLDRPVSLMNAALSSSTEKAMVGHFEGELLAYQPDIVIFNSRPNQEYLNKNCRPLSRHQLIATAQKRSAFIKKFYDYQPGDLEQRLLLQRLRNGVVAQTDPVAPSELTNYQTVIERLIDITRSRDIALVLGTMSFRQPSDSPDFRNGVMKAQYWAPCHSATKLLDAYQAANDVLRQLAGTNDGVELFDIERLLNGQDRYFVPKDIIHHTIAGNALIVEQLAPQLSRLIGE